MSFARAGLFGLVALLLAAPAALARDSGEDEYMQACAACHGETGIGDGPLAGLINIDVPDLTQLSAQNGGSFPMQRVIQIIDGRTGLRGHGSPMPVWGDRFTAEALPEAGAYGAELVVRGRILSIAYFLESIQK